MVRLVPTYCRRVGIFKEISVKEKIVGVGICGKIEVVHIYVYIYYIIYIICLHL